MSYDELDAAGDAKALSSANVRIIRWPAKAIPDVTNIKSTFMNNTTVK